MRPLAEQKGVAIDTRLDAAIVVGDRDRLTDLATNLVSNAVRYNHDGGRVSVEVWPDGSDACIRVTDTGTGINPDSMASIFRPFFTTKKKRGTGLGLSVCDRIMKAHGGTVGVESQQGVGTTFYLRFPLMEAGNGEPVAGAHPHSR